MSLKYGLLANERHPDYDAAYWAKIRALYAGGRKLLGNKQVLESVFPMHMREPDWIYKERLKRAFYIPYVGQLIDYIVAALSGHPIEMVSEPSTVDGFYKEFTNSVSRPGGCKLSLQQLIRTQMLTALQLKRAWCLVDFPQMDPRSNPLTLADQERVGALRAYAVPVEPECVLDWERDEDTGDLLWALVSSTAKRRDTLESPRNEVQEIYTLYTKSFWQRYEVRYHVDGNGQSQDKPKDETELAPTDEGDHSFGRVPLVELCLEDGLWAGGKIESIATEHFNKRCALSWGQYKSLFQFIAVNLQAPTANDPRSEDQNRGTNQIVGPGRALVLAEKDQIRYVSPDAEPFRVAMEDLAQLRDEMHRVLHQMALSVDNSAGALQRSAESKQVDQAAATVVLKRLGQIEREFAVDLYEMVSRGRADGIRWDASGAEGFDELTSEAFVTEAETVEGLSIPSQSFQCDYKYDLIRKLRPTATEDELETYYDELKANISAESLSPNPDALPPDDETDVNEPMIEPDEGPITVVG